MPRKSLRQKTIDAVIQNVKKLQLKKHLRDILGEEDVFEDYKLVHHKSVLRKMIDSRYLFRSSNNRTNRKKFDLDDTLSYESVECNDEEFLLLYRITRDSLICF